MSMTNMKGYPDDLKDIKMYYTIQETFDFNGEVMIAPCSIIDIAQLYTDEVAREVVGTDDADGTSILTISIADEAVFICTQLKGSTNVSALIAIGTGDLGDPPTDVTFIDLQNIGEVWAQAEVNSPLFVINNIGGDADVTLRMWVPHTAFGVATNDDANHYFNGYIGGILLT